MIAAARPLSAAPSGGGFVVLGKIVEAYGVQGWVRVHPFGDDPLSWKQIPVWRVGDEGDAPESWPQFELRGCRVHSGTLVVRFEGIDDRTAAEGLKGRLIGAPRESLPETDDDEYYWADLIGLEVVNTLDESLGRVAGLIETGANDVLRVVAEDGSERLLPFVAAVVLEVDPKGGRVRVDWGLDW